MRREGKTKFHRPLAQSGWSHCLLSSPSRRIHFPGFQHLCGKLYPSRAIAIEDRRDEIVSARFGDGHAGFGISR